MCNWNQKQIGLARLLCLVWLICAMGSVGVGQGVGGYDPMRRVAPLVGGVGGFDPMRRSAVGGAIEVEGSGEGGVDVMAYYARRGLHDVKNPMTSLIVGAGVAAVKVDPTAPFGGMPEGAGRELTFGFCGACHSIKLVTQQHLTDKRWDEVWDWMIEKQRMAALEGDVKDLILGYLKEHYSAGLR